MYQPQGLLAPLFVVANYGFVDRTSIVVYNLPTHAVAAESYAAADAYQDPGFTPLGAPLYGDDVPVGLSI